MFSLYNMIFLFLINLNYLLNVIASAKWSHSRLLMTTLCIVLEEINIEFWDMLLKFEEKCLIQQLKKHTLLVTFNKNIWSLLAPCEKASCIHADPTLGAPSFNTQSAFHVWSSFLRSCSVMFGNENEMLDVH